jgi:hypothetical protein
MKSLNATIASTRAEMSSSSSSSAASSASLSSSSSSSSSQAPIEYRFEPREFSDLTITLGQATFYVHKQILAAASQYFTTILVNDKECKQISLVWMHSNASHHTSSSWTKF